MIETFDIPENEDTLWTDEIGAGMWWLQHHTACILGLIPSEQAGLKLSENHAALSARR